jgi:hypothetical protein
MSEYFTVEGAVLVNVLQFRQVGATTWSPVSDAPLWARAELDMAAHSRGYSGTFMAGGLHYQWRQKPVEYCGWDDLQRKLAALPTPPGATGRWQTVHSYGSGYCPRPYTAQFRRPPETKDYAPVATVQLDEVIPDWVEAQKKQSVDCLWTAAKWCDQPGWEYWVYQYLPSAEDQYELDAREGVDGEWVFGGKFVPEQKQEG